MRTHRLMLAGSLLLGAASAQAFVHRIETIPANPRPGQAFQIRVSGEWPNACPLQVMPVVVSGTNIDVSVKPADQICGEAVTPYSVTVDPSAVAGASFPAAVDYRIRYSVKDASNTAKLLAFRVVDVAVADQRAAEPEPGFWAPDAAGEFPSPGSGIGFMVERQGNTLALTTNTYLLNGQAAWYLSAGSISGSVFRGDLLKSIGGQPLWGTYRGPQSVDPVGTLDVEFLSNSQAVLWYTQASGPGLLDAVEVMPISVRRMNFALAPDGQSMAGTWAYTPTDTASRLSTVLIQLVYRADRSTPTLAVLADPQKGYEMQCQIDSARADGPPRSCALLSGGLEVARFGNNTLNKLAGQADAEAVVMVRISN